MTFHKRLLYIIVLYKVIKRAFWLAKGVVDILNRNEMYVDDNIIVTYELTINFTDSNKLERYYCKPAIRFQIIKEI